MNFAEEMRRTIATLTPGPGDMQELVRVAVSRRIQQIGEVELRQRLADLAASAVDDGNDTGLDEYAEGLKKSAAKDAVKTFCDNLIEWAK